MTALPKPSDEAVTLAETLAAWNRAYYDGEALVTDEVWQEARDRLSVVWPGCPLLHTVGAAPSPKSALQKAQHGIPMGSLSNAFDEAEIKAFVDRVQKLAATAGLEAPRKYVTQPKCDGLSIELRYENSKLVQAITRGDGIEGEDVSHNLMRAKGVPHAVPSATDFCVRGEVVITRADCRDYFPDAANARNAVAGTCRRLDGSGAEHLRFLAFDAVAADGTDLAPTESKTIMLLARMGFGTVSCDPVDDSGPGLLPEVLRRWAGFKNVRATLPYDCDGLVLKVNNRAMMHVLGETDSCPRGHVAMKWRGSMVAEGVLRAVEHSVGRTGTITPVGVLDPVEVGGVVVTRVSLCNYDEVVRLKVRLGSRIRLERAGDVIPKITATLSSPGDAPAITRPARCPKCNSVTEADGPRQMCPNELCPARMFRSVLHWVKQRNIMFLGEEAVDRLMAIGGPVNDAADLYALTNAQLATACGGVVMADKVAENLEASRDCALPEFLGSVGIPGLGISEARKLVEALDLASVPDFIDTCRCGLGAAPIKGFGETKAQKISEGCQAMEGLIRRLAKHMRITAATKPTGPLAGQKFCITGETAITREQLKAIICKAGAVWHSSVVRGLDFLIMQDPKSNSTKAKKARADGIRCISEGEALDLAGFTK